MQALRDSYEQVFKQGAAEGVGFYFSTGDCGYYDPATRCGKANGSIATQVEYPSDDPWLTSVGGTTLALDATGNPALADRLGRRRVGTVPGRQILG